ncbi:unnamed protein product, partial [Choristocarpus tenellus]
RHTQAEDDLFGRVSRNNHIKTVAKFEDCQPNLARRCSYVYGADATRSFLKVNRLWGVVRAYSVQEEGFCRHFANNGNNGTVLDFDRGIGTG